MVDSQGSSLGPWLYLPVEVKVRELDAKLLLAYHAINEGFRVVLGEHVAVERVAKEGPPGIFFSKGYPDPYKSRVFKLVKRVGHRLVELDEEGLIIPNRKGYIESRMNQEFVDQLDHIYCWGRHQQGVITDAYPHVKTKTFLTGNPRFDLLKEKYRRLYHPRVHKIREEYGDFLLINTRFAVYNQVRRQQKHDDSDLYRYMKKLFSSFIELIDYLSSQNPYQMIVIRPHPAENVEVYKRHFNEQPNITIAPYGNVVDWILASKLMIHNNCTTGIEAGLLGKPAISYKPISPSDFDDPLPSDFSIQATTLKDVQETVANIQENPNHPSLTIRQLNLLNYHVSGWTATDAYQHLINSLKEIPIKNNSTLDLSSTKRKRRKNRNAKYRFPRLTEREIRHFFNKLEQIEGKQSRINTHAIDRNVFILTSKG
ncbi:surface carbohydrate biosynthesis protein [Alkalibacillus aidingensis]|uniref:surface carbohydrate biosynthesis protein n=1 Tax=Alkalibacillus aidingensis TaxID=2747607 RepID=UPI0016608D1D|nr:surface carbohydrate biosynthesis protein [Alkalibacillus aidingensis]